MIGAALFSIITASTLIIYSKLQRKQMQAQIQSNLKTEADQMSVVFSQALDNAVFLNGDTTDSTHFEGTRTYGIMRSPFAAPGISENNDGLRLFEIDDSNSTSSTYQVTAIAINSGKSDITVTGDFQPLHLTAEDLFIMKSGSLADLFTVETNISYSGGSSSFTATEDASNYIDYVTHPEVQGYPEIYRVKKVTYQIGNGSDQTTGLYRITPDETRFIARDVVSMQVRYELSSRDGDATTDCTSKNDSRYFDLDASSTDCDWNDIVALHVDLVFESTQDVGATETKNPITGETDSYIKLVRHISKSPLNYVSNLTN